MAGSKRETLVSIDDGVSGDLGSAAAAAADDAPGAGAAATRPADVPLWLLALFTFSGTLAMHIFVPALPYAAQSLSTSNGAIQLTISLYIAGLAVGQLIYGPVSDRFGRRPTLMVGLVVYTLAGCAAALAPTLGSLVVARVFQALGGCAGLVLARAIVRDTGSTESAARRLALMNLVVVVGPGVAPLIGTALAATVGWRAIFGVLCALGVANFILAWRLLHETAAVDVHANAGVGQLGRNYASLLKSPSFIGYAVGGGCSTTAMYAYVASAPFIFVHQLGRPASELGIYLALLIPGIWVGSATTSRLIRTVPLRTLLVRGNVLSICGALTLLAASALGWLSVPVVVLSMLAFTIGVGVSSPAALTKAISVNPLVTGSASGLYGFAQMGVGAVCTAMASLGDDPALTVGIVLTCAGFIAQASFWLASGRNP